MGECGFDKERLSALVDGELQPTEQRAAEDHLAECADCRAETEALRRVRDHVRDLPSETVTAAADWDRVWSGVERALPRRRVRRRRENVILHLWARPRPALAAAALVLALVSAGMLSYGLWPRESMASPSELTVADVDDVLFESISYDPDDYTLVVMAPGEGQAPVLWVSYTAEP